MPVQHVNRRECHAHPYKIRDFAQYTSDEYSCKADARSRSNLSMDSVDNLALRLARPLDCRGARATKRYVLLLLALKLTKDLKMRPL